jgi:hypothetical protein
MENHSILLILIIVLLLTNVGISIASLLKANKKNEPWDQTDFSSTGNSQVDLGADYDANYASLMSQVGGGGMTDGSDPFGSSSSADKYSLGISGLSDAKNLAFAQQDPSLGMTMFQ